MGRQAKMNATANAPPKQADVHHAGAMPAQPRRNFGLGVVSGVAYNLYVAVLSTELVMAWFLSELTDSNLLIGLLIRIELGSWYFLQLLLSGQVQRRPRALPIYRAMGVLRLAALALLALATWKVDDPNALLILFLVTFTIGSLAAGVSALPFLSVVAKIIPPQRRGMYFGWRRFLGGSLGLLGGLMVKTVLSPDSGLTFPDNYALLFFLGLLITTVLVISFSLVAEPAEQVDPTHVNLREQLRRAVRLPPATATTPPTCACAWPSLPPVSQCHFSPFTRAGSWMRRTTLWGYISSAPQGQRCYPT
jgi:hypothetical protein